MILSLKMKEEKTEGKGKASESTRVEMYGQYPPVEKMDASLSTLTACEYVLCVFMYATLLGYIKMCTSFVFII